MRINPFYWVKDVLIGYLGEKTQWGEFWCPRFSSTSSQCQPSIIVAITTLTSNLARLCKQRLGLDSNKMFPKQAGGPIFGF